MSNGLKEILLRATAVYETAIDDSFGCDACVGEAQYAEAQSHRDKCDQVFTVDIPWLLAEAERLQRWYEAAEQDRQQASDNADRQMAEVKRLRGMVDAIPSADHLKQVIAWLNMADDFLSRIEVRDKVTGKIKKSTTDGIRKMAAGDGIQQEILALIAALTNPHTEEEA